MILGRTNEEFASVWYRPVAAGHPEELAQALCGIATHEVQVIDVSSQPALWGGLLRRYSGRFLARSAVDFERATSEKHAMDLLEAHLIETLSSIGRPCIDFYGVRCRERIAESTLAGVLQSLELARQDGMVGFTGLVVENDEPARAMWRSHDAFDFVLLKRDSTLDLMARERRVGIVRDVPEGGKEFGSDTRLITVSEPAHLKEGCST